MNIRQAQRRDYPQILQLQHDNTPDHLNDAQRRQGFIASQMDESQLDAINNGLGILIVCDGDKVAGFACLNHTDQRPRPGVVDAMLAALPDAQFAGQPLRTQRLFIYGPVCLNSTWRGKGLLRQLLNAVKQHTQEKFDAGIAFINDSNPHSLAAHVQGLGMTDVLKFSYRDEIYHLIAFATCDGL